MGKTNYNELMKKEIAGLNGRVPSLLLHVCCAPCLAAALPKLTGKFNITVYFYNPNITPEAEYELRRIEVSRLAESYGINVISGDYDFARYMSAVGEFYGTPEHGRKCELCMGERIMETAKLAAKLGAEYFSTTLSSGPLKNAETINGIMKKASEKTGVKFLPSDFKKDDGTVESIKTCKELGLYRQRYCGCTPARGVSIGITGGAGSGKSVALKIMEREGLKVFSADDMAKKIEQPGTEVFEAIKKEFPSAVEYDGINRRKLAAEVFGDAVRRKALENIVHPALLREILTVIAETDGLFAIEVPLLFEKGLERFFDVTIALTAPVEERIHRVMKRDGRTESEAGTLISSQADDSVRLQADRIIVNDGTLSGLEDKVLKLLGELKAEFCR